MWRQRRNPTHATSSGRVASRTQTSGGVSLTTGYTWFNGRMSGMTTPSGQALGYTWTNGRISAVTLNGVPLVTAAGYEPFGPVSVWQWGNGHKTYRDHDLDGRLSTWEYRNGASILRRELTWDHANRITAIADPSGTNSATYGYDVLDRLTSALRGGVSRGYGYDAIGNRTQSNVDAASTTYTYPGTSHRLQSLTGATTRSYVYDAAGNPTQIDAAVHGYNLANRLTTLSSTSSASYAINGLGQRVAKTVDGVTTRYVYDEQGRLIGEYDQAGNLIQETVWLDDLPIATLRPTGSGTPTPIAVYYVHADHLGSPRAITRPADDAIVWRWDNAEPFGANAANENPSGLGNFRYDLRFPGQQYDPETGTNYNYFRDYDPTVGRYLQSDPIGLEGGIGSYVYADESPVSLIDSFGLQAFAPPAPPMASPVPPPAVPGFPSDPPRIRVPEIPSWLSLCAGSPILCAIRYLSPEVCRPGPDCEEWLRTDTRTCNAITRRRGPEKGAACHASASERYAACLSGEPVPPLNTWNN